MKVTKEQLEKLILEELENSLDEGVLGGLGSVAKGMGGLAKKGYKAVKDLYKTGSEEENAAKRARTELEKDLVLISSFIDAAERNPQVSQFILSTELGKKLFEPEMQNEAYGANQLLKMMKAKKIDAQMVGKFFKAIEQNQAANKLLNQVKAMTPGYEPEQTQAEPAAPAAAEPAPAAPEPAAPEAAPAAPEPAAPAAGQRTPLQQALKDLIDKLMDYEPNERPAYLKAVIRDLRNTVFSESKNIEESKRWQKLAGILKD